MANFVFIVEFFQIGIAALFDVAGPLDVIAVYERRQQFFCFAVRAITNPGFDVYPHAAVYL